MVDLAGSEKYRASLGQTNSGVKVSELTSINASLSELGKCISALSDSKRKHIPFRNCTLTKVLKDSLVDSLSSVVLIICVSPSIDSFQETQSTLKFADRAKKVVIKPPKMTKSSNTSTN